MKEKLLLLMIVLLLFGGCAGISYLGGRAGKAVAGNEGEAFGASLGGPEAVRKYYNDKNREEALRSQKTSQAPKPALKNDPPPPPQCTLPEMKNGKLYCKDKKGRLLCWDAGCKMWFFVKLSPNLWPDRSAYASQRYNRANRGLATGWTVCGIIGDTAKRQAWR